MPLKQTYSTNFVDLIDNTQAIGLLLSQPLTDKSALNINYALKPFRQAINHTAPDKGALYILFSVFKSKHAQKTIAIDLVFANTTSLPKLQSYINKKETMALFKIDHATFTKSQELEHLVCADMNQQIFLTDLLSSRSHMSELISDAQRFNRLTSDKGFKISKKLNDFVVKRDPDNTKAYLDTFQVIFELFVFITKHINDVATVLPIPGQNYTWSQKIKATPF